VMDPGTIPLIPSFELEAGKTSEPVQVSEWFNPVVVTVFKGTSLEASKEIYLHHDVKGTFINVSISKILSSSNSTFRVTNGTKQLLHSITNLMDYLKKHSHDTIELKTDSDNVTCAIENKSEPLLMEKPENKTQSGHIEKTKKNQQKPVLNKERSKLFIKYVEHFNPESHAGANSYAKTHAHTILSTDSKTRQKQLLEIYTGNSIYGELNRCLRHDEEEYMKLSAGYIRELRDIFRTDKSSIVSTFKGIVWRGITVPDPASTLKVYEKDEELVWPSFTSTSSLKKASFGGNINFEINCSAEINGYKAKYAPAVISSFSVYKSEEEVLFPPHVKFRVVNKKGSHVWLETTEFPSVWDLIENARWDDFEKWAHSNPDRVNTKSCSFSIINKVVEKAVNTDKANLKPLNVCLEHNADIDEIDPETGQTPFTMVANTFADAGLDVTHSEVTVMLTWFVKAGADPSKTSKYGKAPTDILPKLKEAVPMIKKAIGSLPIEEKVSTGIMNNNVRWEYHVGQVPVDGKLNNWYPYHPSTWAMLEHRYQDYLKGFDKITVIKSKGDSHTNFNYAVDFSTMTQTNMTTKTKRPVRRIVDTGINDIIIAKVL